VSLTIRTEENDVKTRLDELELNVDQLVGAVNQGYLARTDLTANHPRTFFGSTMWAHTIAALRDNLRSAGWIRPEHGNYEITVNPDLNLAINVITGNDGTGLANRKASNKCPKGVNTVDAIAANNQIDMFAEYLPEVIENTDFVTWILLVHVADDEVRAELSLPSEICNGMIKDWKERIILPSFPREDDSVDIRIPDLPEIDVPIRRKA